VNSKKIYSAWFLVPSLTIFGIFFLVPLITSLFFSLTVWDFKSYTFVGLKNFRMFFSERSLSTSISHTLVYAFMTSGLKVVIAFLIAVFLTSGIKTQNLLRSVVFFPNLVSTIAVGITFAALMHPTKGLFNTVLTSLGLGRIDFLGNPNLALFSVIFTDVWKGVSVATIIYIAGIQSIDRNYYEAASIDGAGKWQKLVNITMPLIRPAMNSVIILSLIGGLRCFDLIWSMTGGGPGFATDVLASVIYKEYAAGFYGLSTAGNIIMFVLIAVIAYPLQRFLLRKEDT
jgi:raffinose/stachyose/melibiose transport system permease protein